MKIKNGVMVRFLNLSDGLLKKKLPIKLFYALNVNLNALSGVVKAYQEAYEKAKDNEKELAELINQEVDVNIQMISKDTLELIDTDPKFDPLTWEEFMGINFMIEE